MPEMGTMHQMNPEPMHIGTIHQLNPEPLHMGTILTPQSQAEQYAREAKEAATEAAQSATDAQTAAESAEQAVAGAVKYSEAQILTAAQQAQARANIGAADAVALAAKQDAPAIAGTEGQVLTIDDQGDPVWATPTDAVSRQEFDALAEDVDWKAPAIIASAGPADIVSITDGAKDAPVKSLAVNIEPVQDLHGYDNPWPAGGGKNKCLLDAETITKPSWYTGGWTGTTLNNRNGINQNRGYSQGGAGGFTISGLSSGMYTFSMTFTGETTYCIFYASSTTDGADYVILVNNEGMSKSGTRYSYTFEVPSGSIQVVIRPTIYTATTEYVLEDIQVESGSTATAWTPYSNICPITGWTGAKVSRTGKNLFDKANAEMVNGYFAAGDIATIITSGSHRIVYIPCKPNTSYVISNSANNRVAVSYAKDSPGARQNVYASGTATITTGADAKYLCVYCFNATIDSCTLQDVLDALQIELGTTATDYEPYQGNTYPITFPTEAGTVYGGTLTVNEDGSGRVVVDMVTADMGNISWTYNSTYSFFSGNIITGKQSSVKILCEIYKNCGTNGTNSNMANAPDGSLYSRANPDGYMRIYTKDLRYSDAVLYKAAMSGVQLVYELKTPITYTLTAPQVRTLLGANNIWAYAGPVSVEYTADTKMYIDSQTRATRSLIAGIETTMTASRPYAASDLLIVGDILYKAAASIASGATLTPGTNVTPTTVAEQLILLANA